MRHALQLELIDRLMAHRAAGTTDAGAAPHRYDASIYTDPALLAAERERLFLKLPLAVGFSSRIPQPGDHFTHEHSGRPIVVCRQPDGSLAAYLNICRHRGARLVPGPLGHSPQGFICPYHAWRYASDGSLQNLPCAHQFAGVEKADHGLFRLPVAEHAGLIFVVPDPAAAPLDLATWLGEFGRELTSFGIGSYPYYRDSTFHPRVNWKMMIEANRESYHIPVLHGASGGPRYRPQLSLHDTQGPHSRIVLPHRSISARTLGESREDWRILAQADVVYFLFPNTLILLSRLAAHVLSAYPAGTGSAIVHGTTLLPPGGHETYPPEFYDAYWTTIGEDITVSEGIQASAEALPGLTLWLGANEPLLAHFHQALQGALATPAAF